MDILESRVRGVSRNKAENLVEEYRNLPTLCWATIYDSEYMQEELHIKGEFLRSQLQDKGLYLSYYGQRLYVPYRVPDWKIDIPQDSYDGRYKYHQENMDDWANRS